jgi:hypothetical protein
MAKTRAYLQTFNPSDIAEPGELHFNVAWVSESEFNEGRAGTVSQLSDFGVNPRGYILVH